MPSPELVSRALALIGRRAVNHDYFFSKLDTPDWIDPLAEAGLFKTPPPPQLEGDMISFPAWPESEYLERMARLAPERVGAAILRIPATENISVHQDLARAAIHVPVEVAAKWALREAKWLSQQWRVHWPVTETLGPVIERLAASGRTDAAIALARSLLELRFVMDSAGRRLLRETSPAYRSDPTTSDGRKGAGDDPAVVALAGQAVVAGLLSRLVPRIDEYEYEEFVRRRVPVLLTHGGPKALEMLCDVLERPHDSDGLEQYTDTACRPAIESHVQNHGDDVADFLIDAVRDGSMQLVDAGTDIRSVARILNGRKGAIFTRILLHLATERCSIHPRFAAELAVSEDRFFDDRLLHEYSRLLGAVFPKLDASQRDLVFGWILRGPSLNEQFAGDQEKRRKLRLHWQARRLAWIRRDLDDEWKRRYARIVEEVGEPEHPDFAWYSATWMGPRSPVGTAYLQAMSTPEVAAYLKSWEPSGDPMSPDQDGLANVLEAVVKASPARFVATYDLFLELPAPYVAALVRGLRHADLEEESVDWAALVAFLSRIATSRSSHPEWRFARQGGVALLSEGLRDDEIQLDQRDAVWAIIDAVADDPHPTPEDDAEPTNDVASRSINCVRGNALHATIHYALWIYRSLVGGIRTDAVTFDMDTIPEVRARLDRHLDSDIDPSPAVRAVYGRWFPHLVLLDADWAERNVERIFPDQHPELRDAAWATYVRFCPVYDTPFQLLREQYAAAVRRLPAREPNTADNRGRPAMHLGEHLLAMAARGFLSWGDDDSLLRGYFENAGPKDAGEAIDWIGGELAEEDRYLQPESVARLASLAEALIDFVQEAGRDRMGHLGSLGWWVASGRYDAEWTLAQLARLIESAGSAKPHFQVMDCLVELSDAHPEETLTVFESWLAAESYHGVLHGNIDSARAILQAALASPSARDRARSFIDRLLAAGHREFRDLRATPH